METPEVGAAPELPPRSLLWQLICVVTGLLGGFSLLLVGHKYLAARIFPPPVVVTNYEVVVTPNPKFIDSLYAAVGQAKTEVVVAAHRLSSQKLLIALRECTARGVSVKVILDPRTNDNPQGGAAGWLLREHAAVVYIDALPNDNQLLVVDRRFVFIGSMPFAADPSITETGIGIYASDPQLATRFCSYLGDRFAQGHALQPPPPSP
jgi:hypothetical protein